MALWCWCPVCDKLVPMRYRRDLSTGHPVSVADAHPNKAGIACLGKGRRV